jgi:hypothetical protein
MNTKSLLLTVIALALSACAPEGPVSVTLTPATAEIEAILLEADARWEKAGVDADRIVIGDGGAPVNVKELGSVKQGHIGGLTVAYRSNRKFGGVRSMTLDALNLVVVMHEMGHAMGVGVGFVTHPFEDTGDCDPEVTDRHNMCAINSGALITEKDLSEVCSVGICTHFTPEVY